MKEVIDQRISWPGWETVRLIGRGSFGAVYEIERDVFGHKEKAALKLISIPQSDSDIEELYDSGYDEASVTATFKSHLQSIVNEYSLMREMNGAANVVNCDDFRIVPHDDNVGWDIFIKMELLTPLTKALSRQPDDAQVIRIAKDMCGALILCKKYGIIHRDIKPQNIFVSKNGDYKLGDFGIAKTIEKTSGGTKIGTYKYMAPEVYNNRPYNLTADIYSLGLVLHWLLNERRSPFMPLPPAPAVAAQEEEARARRFAGEALPAPAHGSEELKRIVLKACAFDPQDRYQSAEEMLWDLEELGGAALRREKTPTAAPVGAAISRPRSAPAEADAPGGPPADQTPDDGTVGAWNGPAPGGASVNQAPEDEDTGGKTLFPPGFVKADDSCPPVAEAPSEAAAPHGAARQEEKEDTTMGVFNARRIDRSPAPVLPAAEEDGTATDSVTYTPKAPAPAPAPKPAPAAPAAPAKKKKFPLWIPLVAVLAVAAVLLIVLLPKGGRSGITDPGSSGGDTVAALNDVKIGVILLHDENGGAHYRNIMNGVREACASAGAEYVFKTEIPEDACCDAAMELVDEGCDFIFAESYGYEEYMIEAARACPGVQFCTAGGTRANTAGLENYHNAGIAVHEARYLGGVAAGAKLQQMIEEGAISRDQAKLGFVGALPYADCISAYTAFFLGARSVCQTATMDVLFTGSWDDPKMEEEAAERLIDGGCVLISQYSESAGAPTACEGRGVPNVAFSEDMFDACPNTCLFYTVLDWKPYFGYVISSMQRNEPVDTDWCGGMAWSAIWVGLNSAAAAPNTWDFIESAMAALADGSLHVFDTSKWELAGETLTEYYADLDDDLTPDTNVIYDGYFHESEFRSAPYFHIEEIDGITIL